MEPADRPDGATLLSDAALDAAVLATLAPTGLAGRIRLRLGGGYTALQVWERLPGPARAGLGEADETAIRRAVERVQRRLHALAADGKVARDRTRMTIRLNTKGPRDIVVDVYRLARDPGRSRA